MTLSDTPVLKQPACAAPNLSLTELSRCSGLSVRVLKYYEEVGLIDPPRAVGNSRIYLGVDLEKIGIVARLRSAGADFSDIAEAFRAPGDDGARRALLALVQRTLDKLASQQDAMTALLKTLAI